MDEGNEPIIYVGVFAERFKALDIYTDDEMYYVPERTCEGCKYEHFKSEILCPGCVRDKRDNYKPAKAVE